MTQDRRNEAEGTEGADDALRPLRPIERCRVQWQGETSWHGCVEDDDRHVGPHRCYCGAGTVGIALRPGGPVTQAQRLRYAATVVVEHFIRTGTHGDEVAAGLLAELMHTIAQGDRQ